jgi:ubiquinone/menaquinone biosynthesis C-methylase UbiE
MSFPALLTLAAASLFGLVFLGWRLVSRRQTLPCPSWLCWLVELDNPLFRNNRASTIIAHLDLRPGMQALDAGCGPGRLTIPMAQRVGPSGRVMAFDLQTGMLERTKVKAEAAGLSNIDFVRGVLGRNVLPLGAFDRAVLVTALGEIPHQDEALREIFESLKPGGILAIVEVIADPHFQNRSHTLAVATGAGFSEKFSTGGRLAYSLYLERPSAL